MPTALVRLNHPLFRGALSLARTPTFLRFAYSGGGVSACQRAWDALDQPDDTPREGETLIVGRLKTRDSVHFDGTRHGRRFGETHATADYELVDLQPTQDVLRDRRQWVKWCEANL
jgi:hypothetical protein